MWERYNAVINKLQEDAFLPKVELFAKIQWVYLVNELHKKGKKNKEGMIRYDFKAFMSSELTLLWSDTIVKQFLQVIDEKNFEEEHYCVMAKVVKKREEAILLDTFIGPSA